jgi:hypothetical protein
VAVELSSAAAGLPAGTRAEVDARVGEIQAAAARAEAAQRAAATGARMPAAYVPE